MGESSNTGISVGQKIMAGRIFPLLFIGVGSVALFFGARNVIHAVASKGWPMADGTVVESKVVSENIDSSTTYSASVTCTFDVDGKSFETNTVLFGNVGTNDSSYAQGIVDRYPKGKHVSVYYMPLNPEEAVLEPGLSWSLFFIPGFGLLFFGVGVLLGVGIPRMIRNVERKEEKLQCLVDATPAFGEDDGQWVSREEAASIEGVSLAILADHRKRSRGGIRTKNHELGKDRDGRVWRRTGTGRQSWYLRSSLKGAASNK